METLDHFEIFSSALNYWPYFIFILISFMCLLLTYKLILRSTLQFIIIIKEHQISIKKILKKNLILVSIVMVLTFIGELFISQQAITIEQNRLVLFVSKFSHVYTQTLATYHHEKISFNTIKNDKLYRDLMSITKDFMNNNDWIISMYTLRKDNQGNNRFLIAPETDYNKNGKIDGEIEQAVPLGEIYDEHIPELEEAFHGKTTFQQYITEDQWGKSISIFIPILKSNGHVDAVLGIDFDPHRLILNIKPIQHSTLIFGIFAIAIILGAFYFITLQQLTQIQTRYFIEKLNVQQIYLEEQVEEEVAKRQEKERMLSHQARLASMGEMIANITHQWRQPLTAISNIVQEMVDAYKYNELDSSSMEESTNSIRSQLKQMSSTIDDFRNFFSPSKTVSTFFAKDQIKTTLMMLQGMFQKHNITVDLFILGDAKIEGYSNEYNHVLINIFNNARDVFEERKINEPRISIHIDEKDNHSIVTISDNAGGIPDAIMGKIFDPYFTTKHHDHGTGIGLYMCKQIIETNMNGRITIHNDDKGAVCTIII